MTFRQFKYYVKADLFRYYGDMKLSHFVKDLLFGIGFKYTFWMRMCAFFKSKGIVFLPFFLLSKCFLRRYMFKFGIQISYNAKIGPGFYIGHFSGIVVNWRTVIGENCNISQGVTIGQINSDNGIEVPTIGNNVYIAPGVKIIGGVKIGNNVAIGANAVVTKDIPDNGVAVGIPAEVISLNGSGNYINRTDYK